MKNWFLFKYLCVTAALAVCFSSCSFLEDHPALQNSDKLACFSSILICKAGASSSCSGKIGTLDIFTYDSNGSLDSYEHVDADGCGTQEPMRRDICSCSGEKRIVIVANMDRSRVGYSDILTYHGLSRLQSSLYKEDAMYPVMSGECSLRAGPGTVHGITLYPLSARVRIRKFEVDFSETGYAGLPMLDKKAYIVNANASCSLLPAEPEVSVDIMNDGHLDRACMESVKSPQLLLYEEDDMESCNLFCYPCTEGSGLTAHPTMLVVEGTLDGHTFYYSFKIGGGIIRRATDYIFDIKITKCGASRPDDATSCASVEAKAFVEPWEEYDWESVDY